MDAKGWPNRPLASNSFQPETKCFTMHDSFVKFYSVVLSDKNCWPIRWKHSSQMDADFDSDCLITNGRIIPWMMIHHRTDEAPNKSEISEGSRSFHVAKLFPFISGSSAHLLLRVAPWAMLAPESWLFRILDGENSSWHSQIKMEGLIYYEQRELLEEKPICKQST